MATVGPAKCLVKYITVILRDQYSFVILCNTKKISEQESEIRLWFLREWIGLRHLQRLVLIRVQSARGVKYLTEYELTSMDAVVLDS